MLHSFVTKIFLRLGIHAKLLPRNFDQTPNHFRTCPVISTKSTGILLFGVEEGSNSDDNVRSAQQRAFEVITAAVKDKEVYDEDRNKECNCLEQCEVQGHVFAHAPTEEDYERRYEEG
jgi:hypothetical protein